MASKLKEKGHHVTEIDEQDYEGTLAHIKSFYDKKLPATLPMSVRIKQHVNEEPDPSGQGS